MITQYNDLNAAKYNELFAKASLALGSTANYTPVDIPTADDYNRTVLEGVVYYTDFTYVVTSDSIDYDTDFVEKAYYIPDVDGDGVIKPNQYVRALLYTPGTVYYELNIGTTIDENNLSDQDADGNFINAFNPAKTYYIATPAIQTLEEYFCQLKTLFNKSYKYIMLPLDEPPLEINANTRTITVPIGFKTASGLSVEGEQLAETLFFRIDRFFDAMDLSTCDISVHWKLPGGREYITIVSMIDVTSEEGKLIFACPITSEITELAGPVEFAAHFIKLGASQSVVYRFNTLPAKANIGESLKLESPHEIGEHTINSLFASAIENSDLAVGSPAPKPVFNIPLGATYTDGQRETGIVYLNKTSDNKLTVNATTSPAGDLKYYWYYTPVTSGMGAQMTKPVDTKEIVLDPTAGSVAGTYQVKVINTKGNKTSRSWSNIVKLPAPNPLEVLHIEPAVIENAENGVVLTNIETTAQPNAKYEHTWKRKTPTGTTFSVVEAHNSNDVTSTDTFVAKVPGWYQVEVKATTNGAVESKQSNEFRVTGLPAVPEFSAAYANTDGNEISLNLSETTEIDLTDGVTVNTNSGDFAPDAIIYHWYIDSEGNGILDVDGRPKQSDENILITSSSECKLELTAALVALIPANSAIRCVVENVLNNRSAFAESTEFVLYGKLTQ